jgi:hypothetical protein
LFSACGFFQRPPQHIQSITAILDQHVRSIGEMLQVVSFGFFDAQAGDAVEQIARGFESVDGSFKKMEARASVSMYSVGPTLKLPWSGWYLGMT